MQNFLMSTFCLWNSKNLIGSAFPSDHHIRASQVALVVKRQAANVETLRDAGSIPGLGRSPGGEHGNPLLCSCLENPRDSGAWWAAIYGVAQSRTRLKWLSSSWKFIEAWLIIGKSGNNPNVQQMMNRLTKHGILFSHRKKWSTVTCYILTWMNLENIMLH